MILLDVVVVKVKAMILDGHEKHLTSQFPILDTYWRCFKLDQPDHPADPTSIPIQLHGDEGTAFQKSHLLLTWMSEVSPHKGDSMAAHLVITEMPNALYAFGENHESWLALCSPNDCVVV